MRAFEIIQEADPQRIQNLAQKVASLPPEVNERLLDKLENILKLAHREDGAVTPAGQATRALGKIKDVDLQKNQFFRVVAKEMVGHELTVNEIATIAKSIKQDKKVNFEEFKKISSSLDKIITTYNLSDNTQGFYNDLFFNAPQRSGPAEVLFATMSKRITKEGKGDLQVSEGEGGSTEVEVKAGKTSGRFRDADVKRLASSNLGALRDSFLEAYPAPIATGWSIPAIIDGMKKPEYDANDMLARTMEIFRALFPKNSYEEAFESAMKAGNDGGARKAYALANIETYFKAKGEKAMAFLFINASSAPYKTCYIDSYEDIANGADKTLTLNPGLAYIVDQSAGDEEYPKISLSAG